MDKFTAIQQKAIEEKLSQLRKVKEGILSAQDLANIITKRRVGWFKKNRKQIFQDFGDLSLPEITYRAIFFSHMKIDLQHSRSSWLSNNKLRIESYNFCPYLEACRILCLDTRYVCRVIGEPSVQTVCSLIDERLKLSRNYACIRPHHSYCEEFIELLV